MSHYNDEHVERLALVQALRSEGFNLATICAVVSRGSRYAQEVRRLGAELGDPSTGIGREWVRMEDEAVAATEELVPGALQRFVGLGSIRSTSDGGYESPAVLVDGSWQLHELGIEPKSIIEVLLATGTATRRLADTCVRILKATDWPGANATDGIDINALRTTLEQVQPLLLQLVATTFEISMARALRARMDEQFARRLRA